MFSHFCYYLSWSITKTEYNSISKDMMFMKQFSEEALENPQVKWMTEIQNILII